MSDARISTGLPGHPKTKKLIRRLGPAGAWHLVCLYLWAAENKPSGELDMTIEDIELAVNWNGENNAFVDSLVDLRLLDGEEGAYEIHDWADHNPWVNGFDLRSARGKWNAVKRHHGEHEADRQVPEYAAVRHATGTENDAGSKRKDATSKKKAAASTKAAPEEPEAAGAAGDATSTEIDAASNANGTKNDAPSPTPYPSPSPNPSTPDGSTDTPALPPDRVGTFEGHETTQGPTPNPAAALAIALNRAGVQVTSLNPDLIEAEREGVTAAALVELTKLDEFKGKPATYLIRAARRMRAEKATAVTTGASNAKPRTGLGNQVRRSDAAPDAIEGTSTRIKT